MVWLALYIGVNIALSLHVRPGPQHPDWTLWSALPTSIAQGHMYDTGPTEAHFVWSPIAGYAMAWITQWIGYWPWLALHVVVVFLLRDWRLIGLVLISWGFWIDATAGNTWTFAFVAGALALRGSRVAAVVFLGMLFLMPRPIALPLAVWILWTMPEVRWPAITLFAWHALGVLASGYGVEWMESMRGTADIIGNLSPTALVGWPWLLVGIPLGAYLALRGYLGWAGMAISPYLLPAYLLTPLWDLRQRQVLDGDVAEVRDRVVGNEPKEVGIVGRGRRVARSQ